MHIALPPLYPVMSAFFGGGPLINPKYKAAQIPIAPNPQPAVNVTTDLSRCLYFSVSSANLARRLSSSAFTVPTNKGLLNTANPAATPPSLLVLSFVLKR